jgi:hypothetical protein
MEGYLLSAVPCWSLGFRPRADKTRNTFICRQGGGESGGGREGAKREGKKRKLNVGLQRPIRYNKHKCHTEESISRSLPCCGKRSRSPHLWPVSTSGSLALRTFPPVEQ